MFNFWNLDLQGSELRAIKGGTQALRYVDAIYTEVNREYLYEDCALLSEMDEYLGSAGFSRISMQMTRAGWGDALYIRKPLVQIPRNMCNNFDQRINGEHKFWTELASEQFDNDGELSACVVDVGAREADVDMVSTFKNASPVVLVEPHPKFYAGLQKAVQQLQPDDQSRVSFRNVGFGEEYGELPYYVTWQSFVKRDNGPGNDIDTLPVICMDDDEVISKQPYIHFLKISTEGFELSVLRGAKNVLTRTCTVQFRYGGIYPEVGEQLKQVFELLQRHGFSYFYILHHGGYSRVHPTNIDQHEQYSNYVACKLPLPYQ